MACSMPLGLETSMLRLINRLASSKPERHAVDWKCYRIVRVMLA